MSAGILPEIKRRVENIVSQVRTRVTQVTGGMQLFQGKLLGSSNPGLVGDVVKKVRSKVEEVKTAIEPIRPVNILKRVTSNISNMTQLQSSGTQPRGLPSPEARKTVGGGL